MGACRCINCFGATDWTRGRHARSRLSRRHAVTPVASMLNALSRRRAHCSDARGSQRPSGAYISHTCTRARFVSNPKRRCCQNPFGIFDTCDSVASRLTPLAEPTSSNHRRAGSGKSKCRARSGASGGDKVLQTALGVRVPGADSGNPSVACVPVRSSPVRRCRARAAPSGRDAARSMSLRGCGQSCIKRWCAPSPRVCPAWPRGG